MAYSHARDLLRLAFMAASNQGVSLAQIEQEFECGRRTAQRMIDALIDTFPETEHRTDDEQRRWWCLPARGISQLLNPTAEELAALSFAAEELERVDAASEARALRGLHHKVRALIPADRSWRLDADEEVLLVAMGHAARPGPRPTTSIAIDAAISTALKGPFHLRLLYQGRNDAEGSPRIVAPHGLLLGFRRYLVALDTSKNDRRMRHYRVEDILEAEVLSTSFTVEENFDLDRHAEQGFASYQDDREYAEVVWRFSPKAADRARRFVFHPSQKTETEPDGSLTVRFQASGLLEMCWHLYAWGDAVEVLQPAALAAMVRGHQRTDFSSLP
jgi:predicted DNA-binding transcriptional regulator YafY